MRRLNCLFLAAMVSALPGCLFQSAPDPTTRSVVFEAVRAPKAFRAMEPQLVEVSMVVGPSGCWRLSSLNVHHAAGVLEISGLATNPNDPDRPCTGAVVKVTRSIDLPPLPAGAYLLRAGSLELDVEVTETSGSAEEQFVYIGYAQVWGTCALVYPGSSYGVLTGLPVDLPWSSEYFARGALVEDSSCTIPGDPEDLQFIVAVDEICPIE